MIFRLMLLSPRIRVVYFCSILLIQLNEGATDDDDHEKFEQIFVQVTLERQVETALEAFERVIADRPEVMECYLMTGDSDYLLRIVVPDVTAYEGFLKNHLTRISGVSSIKSSFALNRVKYETALPLGVPVGADQNI